jgi:hypothetical protein
VPGARLLQSPYMCNGANTRSSGSKISASRKPHDLDPPEAERERGGDRIGRDVVVSDSGGEAPRCPSVGRASARAREPHPARRGATRPRCARGVDHRRAVVSQHRELLGPTRTSIHTLALAERSLTSRAPIMARSHPLSAIASFQTCALFRAGASRQRAPPPPCTSMTSRSMVHPSARINAAALRSPSSDRTPSGRARQLSLPPSKCSRSHRHADGASGPASSPPDGAAR